MMAEAVRSCRVCGCTDDDCRGCIAKVGGPCWWVKADLCSACVGSEDVRTDVPLPQPQRLSDADALDLARKVAAGRAVRGDVKRDATSKISALTVGEWTWIRVPEDQPNKRSACLVVNHVAYRVLGPGKYEMRTGDGGTRIRRLA